MSRGLALLRELRDAKRLEADFPLIAPALAEELDTPDPHPAALQRAGRLLAGLDHAAVLALHPGTPRLTVAVTGQSTVAELTAPLTAELARHGLLCDLRPGDHGAWARDLDPADAAGAFHGVRAGLTLCLLDAETVFAQVPAVWDVPDVARAAEAVLGRLTALARARAGHGTLVLNTLPLPRHHTHRLVDHRSRAALGALWREVNARLLRLTAELPHLVVLDLDPLLAEGGPAADPRLAAYAGARLGAGLLAAYAREAGHLARALTGRTRKCLVLDLDNTLWDGILAEDGPEGIAAAGTLRGEAFGAFQRTVAHLCAQGVLLAVSSKNDREAVLDALRNHPDLVLREADFAHVAAGWGPKDAALEEIAARLGVGTDALVFADDTPAERAQVRHRLPHTAVVPLDDEPALHVTRLLADGWFDTPGLTGEDRARAAHYRRERERGELRESTGSHEEFLRELGVRVHLGPPEPHEHGRLAQLTQRTNQFNLTGLRLTPDDTRTRAAGPDALLLAARTADRFGANGLVGAVLGRRAADGWHLDNVWLSCRVLARGIETATLAAVLQDARAQGAPAVYARYRPTPKNRRAGDFYPSLGFARHAVEEDGTVHYRHDLTEIPAVPGHIALDRTGPATIGRSAA
ncbi:FkbH-like protein [Streptomyces olivoverticillatus]|uniref:FkbH-like protein n=1 Tax=Streptomyces olivoverticillatus TaxID=66427 RepID=A0A7W7PJN0_9ACTN|nr:FkbH-like protein [Streptomyces olivoverticillatus]